MKKIKEYQDSEAAISDFRLLAKMAEQDPEALADLLMLLRNILIARGFTLPMLSAETGYNIEAIETALLPSNKNPDEKILLAVMYAAGFDLKNWSDTKRSLEKITSKYDEVLRKLSKT
jgi:DNA-binding phage protein